MTFTAIPWAIQGTQTPAEVGRQLVRALIGGPVAAVAASNAPITTAGGIGVVGANDLKVTQHGGGAMSVDVAVGACFMPSTETGSLTGATYFGMNDASVTVTISTADATNPRIDLIVARAPDSNYSGASTTATISVVTGTPAGGPTAPTPPSNSLILAQIAVAATVTTILTANITDKRLRAVALGGHQPCTSTTRPTGASLYNGLWIDEIDTFRTLKYDGTGWIIMYEPVQTYSPTLNNVTLGSGTRTAVYQRRNGGYDVLVGFTMGSGSAIGGDVSFLLPFASADSLVPAMFNCSILDSGSAWLPAIASCSGSQTVFPRAVGTASAYATEAAFSSTVPITWSAANADNWFVAGHVARMSSIYS